MLWRSFLDSGQNDIVVLVFFLIVGLGLPDITILDGIPVVPGLVTGIPLPLGRRHGLTGAGLDSWALEMQALCKLTRGLKNGVRLCAPGSVWCVRAAVQALLAMAAC